MDIASALKYDIYYFTPLRRDVTQDRCYSGEPDHVHLGQERKCSAPATVDCASPDSDYISPFSGAIEGVATGSCSPAVGTSQSLFSLATTESH